jgi:S-formylglutathione hydrolase FrmB
MQKSAQVYLPEGYETSGLDYTVVYFIHGMTSHHMGNPEVVDATEQLIEDGLIEPIILVKPDAHCLSLADAGFDVPIHTSLTNSELNGSFEDYFVEDLVQWVDATYRTIPDREHRFVFGHSQGGYAAMRAALRHPDLFAAVGTHAGALTFEPLAEIAQYMIASDYPDGPPYEYRPDAGFISKVLFAYGASFTPNLSNPPWYVDLPWDEYAQPDPEVWPRFVAHSNTRWATQLKASGAELDIYFEVGTRDDMAADYLNLYFAAALDAIELPYTFRWFDGDHHSHIGIRTPNQLTFFMPLDAAVDLEPRVINAPGWWLLVQASIELPGDLEAEEIDASTLKIIEVDGVRLDHPIRAFATHDISDVNGNGRDDLTVWFDKRPLLRTLMAMGIGDLQPFEITIAGELDSGWFLTATDSQQVVNLDDPRARELLTPVD